MHIKNHTHIILTKKSRIKLDHMKGHKASTSKQGCTLLKFENTTSKLTTQVDTREILNSFIQQIDLFASYYRF